MIFNFLCKHRWKSHLKKQITTRTFVANILGDGYNPTDITKDITREVLICEKCGKIKKIEY